MASPDLHSPWIRNGAFDDGGFDIHVDEVNSADVFDVFETSSFPMLDKRSIPEPPPFPSKIESRVSRCKRVPECSQVKDVPREIVGLWDKPFGEGYGADVFVVTETKSIVPAHSDILSIASLVFASILKQSKVRSGIRYINIRGVPSEAVYIFIRFLYSSSYEEEEMKKFVLHLLVLSHAYSIPSLKKVCEHTLENGWLTNENVIDVLQLARSCGASRLAFICVRMVLKDFKAISSTEGWKAMKLTDPALEHELLEFVIDADTRKQERSRKMEEQKVYLQLYEAMEALLHICKDGCRTIGPYDKALKGSQGSCNFPACKGLERLVRHFSNCKARVTGVCPRCKHLWQLLELHSRLCNETDLCKVPLCRDFKEKMQQKNKKDEARWKLLVAKVIAAKGPFVLQRVGLL